jgi:hypothetical protein
MAMNTERKIVAAAVTSSILGLVALLLSLSSLMLGVGARDDGIVGMASTGGPR